MHKFFSALIFSYAKLMQKTLIYRSVHNSSSYINFNNEIKFLKTFFQNIGNPLWLFHNYSRLFLKKIYEPKSTMTTVPKQTFYFSFPYFGQIIDNINSEIKIQSDFPQINLKFAFTSSKSVFSFLDIRKNWILLCALG